MTVEHLSQKRRSFTAVQRVQWLVDEWKFRHQWYSHSDPYDLHFHFFVAIEQWPVQQWCVQAHAVLFSASLWSWKTRETTSWCSLCFTVSSWRRETRTGGRKPTEIAFVCDSKRRQKNFVCAAYMRLKLEREMFSRVATRMLPIYWTLQRDILMKFSQRLTLHTSWRLQ